MIRHVEISWNGPNEESFWRKLEALITEELGCESCPAHDSECSECSPDCASHFKSAYMRSISADGSSRKSNSDIETGITLGIALACHHLYESELGSLSPQLEELIDLTGIDIPACIKAGVEEFDLDAMISILLKRKATHARAVEMDKEASNENRN